MGNSQPNNQPASWLSRHEPVTNEFQVTVNIKQQKNSPKVLSPESKKWSLIAFFQVNGSVIPNYASMICIDWQEESDDNGLCLPAHILVTKEEGGLFRHWSTFLLKWSTILFQRMECCLRLPGNWIILCCVILKKYRAVNVFRVQILLNINQFVIWILIPRCPDTHLQATDFLRKFHFCVPLNVWARTLAHEKTIDILLFINSPHWNTDKGSVEKKSYFTKHLTNIKY